MIQDISWYQTGTNQWVSQMWIRLLIAIPVNGFFLSVQNVEDTDMWGYFFWYITLICVLCQRTQIWGNIYFGGHRSEYDIRGHRFEEICFWKDIDLSVTSEDIYLRGQGFGRKWSLTYIYIYIYKATVQFWMEGGPVLLTGGCWIQFGKVTTKRLSQTILDSHTTTWSADYQQ